MSELRDIADAKIDAARTKLIASTSDAIEAIKRRNAAAGNLRSGHTMLEITKACQASLEALGEAIDSNYTWATLQALFSTQSSVDDLVNASRACLASASGEFAERIKREGASIAVPANAVAECLNRLDQKLHQVSEDVKLSLRAKFAELKRSRVRKHLERGVRLGFKTPRSTEALTCDG